MVVFFRKFSEIEGCATVTDVMCSIILFNFLIYNRNHINYQHR